MQSKYLAHYPNTIKEQVAKLINEGRLSSHLKNKYPEVHNHTNDKALYNYTMDFKNNHMRNSPPLSKVVYDGKINVISHALGTHTFVSRVQGGKLKAKNEIRIASIFKQMPEPFLRMIVVHELAHFKVKGHDKAFYALCTHIEPNYHQFELDMRLYLTHIDLYGKLWI
jgi:predicted metal-dependent hydrolase